MTIHRPGRQAHSGSSSVAVLFLLIALASLVCKPQLSFAVFKKGDVVENSRVTSISPDGKWLLLDVGAEKEVLLPSLLGKVVVVNPATETGEVLVSLPEPRSKESTPPRSKESVPMKKAFNAADVQPGQSISGTVDAILHSSAFIKRDGFKRGTSNFMWKLSPPHADRLHWGEHIEGLVVESIGDNGVQITHPKTEELLDSRKARRLPLDSFSTGQSVEEAIVVAVVSSGVRVDFGCKKLGFIPENLGGGGLRKFAKLKDLIIDEITIVGQKTKIVLRQE